MKKVDPSLIGLLGRYEFTAGTSNKFWSIEFDPHGGTYTTIWGRIGTLGSFKRMGQVKYGLTGVEALKKIQEKVQKGYLLKSERIPSEEQIEAAKRVALKREGRAREQKEAYDFMEELRNIK